MRSKVTLRNHEMSQASVKIVQCNAEPTKGHSAGAIFGGRALAQEYTVAALQLVSVACKYNVFRSIRQRLIA